MRARGRPVTLPDAKLLDAARDVFLARGLDATTTEIAQKARISESVIFYRYKTKEALFIAVMERELVPPAAVEKLASLVGKGTIAEHLYDVGVGVLDLTQAVMPFMMMAFAGSRKMVQRLRGPHPVRGYVLRQLSGYFEAEARRGRLDRVDPEILARTFLGGIQQYVISTYLDEDRLPLPRNTYLRGMIDLLLAGANPRRKPARRARR